MNDVLTEIWANEFYRKTILTVVILFAQSIVRQYVIDRWLSRISEDSVRIYAIRKVSRTVVTVATVIILFGVWVQRSTDLSIAIGILGAGIAFALQEVIGSIAGWITILSGKPFAIGDRIETGGIRGDVVDINVLRTSLMEIGNWLDGDHNTGRIVTVSNAFLFKEPLYNYAAHLHFIWDELKIPVAYDSNWKRAIEIMTNTVLEHPAYRKLLPKAEKQRREVRQRLAVKMTPLEPRTFVKLTDNWVGLGLVYPVETDVRRTFRSEISQTILSAFEAEGIKVASQTIAITRFPSESQAKAVQ